MKVAVLGVPRSGKTILAKKLAAALDHPVVHSDSFIDYGWNGCKVQTLAAARRHGADVVVEGVTVGRILDALQPDVIVLCKRTDLASPMHRSMAARLERALHEWPHPDRIVLVRDAHKKSALEELVSELRAKPERN